MELNFEKLNEFLSHRDGRAALVNYIYQKQGFELRRVDFKAAAERLGKSDRTVRRYIAQLADLKIILLQGDSIKLNQDVLKAI